MKFQDFLKADTVYLLIWNARTWMGISETRENDSREMKALENDGKENGSEGK